MLLVVGLIGALGYVLLVDLGVSAGRIHHGVTVAGVDLGGLTASEAVTRLQQRAREIKDAPIVLTGGGMELSLFPTELEWRPRPDRSAARAMRVGRDDAPFGALVDRTRAWFGGIDLDWAGRADPKLVLEVVDEVEQRVAEMGRRLNRGLLRFRIRNAITTWPREAVDIPFEV